MQMLAGWHRKTTCKAPQPFLLGYHSAYNAVLHDVGIGRHALLHRTFFNAQMAYLNITLLKPMAQVAKAVLQAAHMHRQRYPVRVLCAMI